MIGNTTIELNQATMIQAVLDYLKKQMPPLAEKLNVLSVEEEKGHGTFIVKFETKENHDRPKD